MDVLLFSANSDIAKGGIVTWTKAYLAECEQNNIHCDIVNTVVIGRRAINGTAKLSICDDMRRTLRIIKEEKRLLKSKKFDIVHFNTNIGKLGIIRDYFLAKKIYRRKVPLVVQVHCNLSKSVTNSIANIFAKKLFLLGTSIVVLNQSDQKFLEDKFSLKSEVIPNFIDESLIVSSKAINDTVKKIVFVGRVSKGKGAELFFSLAKIFSSICFELIGEIDQQFLGLERHQNLLLKGSMSHEEVIKELDEADIFLFPSRSEGFSLALTEAMARGLPIIATDVGANAEMIEGKGGIVVPVDDSKSIQDAIKELMNPQIRMKMSKWNIDKVKTCYETKSVFASLIKLYNKLLGEKNDSL